MTIEQYVKFMWETDHLPWCKEHGYDPGTFENYEKQIKPFFNDNDLQ